MSNGRRVDPARRIRLELTGREQPPQLPALLKSTTRSAGAADDPFLPANYLTPRRSFDVGPAARSAEGGLAEQSHDAEGDEVVVVELTDGSLYVTSAQRLRDTLSCTRPDLVDGDTVLFEKLRADGAACDRSVGGLVGGLASRVFTFLVGDRDEIVADALADLGARGLVDAGLSGLSWAGTRALMAAIESRLDGKAGELKRWVGASGGATDFDAPDWSRWRPAKAADEPMLVFIHGTGSSTLGSFGELRSGDRDLWATLEAKFTGGIYAFEHRTLSESPITNAIQLATALPQGAHVSLVSHSRGGLVADLLCLDTLPAPLIERYRFRFEGTGDPDAGRAEQVIEQLETAHAEHRAELAALTRLVADRKLVIDRYVRAASPAQGTRLASGNFDLFLSGILTLVGQVPFLFGNPVYSAFKRVVIEIAKRRTDPHLVPGIEAMLPDSPMARLLHDAPVRAGIRMAVVAGDIQGGSLLQRLGVLLTDFLLFENTDNDLVVDTPAMLSGIAPRAQAHVLFDRGADVSHFRYFKNYDTRSALRDWLVEIEPDKLDAFRPLPTPEQYAAALADALTRDAAGAPDRPVVVVLPGVMGSHLRAGSDDRVWFDPLDIATGGLAKLKWGADGIEADELFSMSYGEVCRHLVESHRVERFPYDWRQPLDVLAERLGEFLAKLLKETKQPIRLLAHSMGGLVVRACIHSRRSVMDELMARDDARLVMLGTPNQGAHSMVENLLGKGDTLRTLVRLDVKNDMQGVLDLVAGFRGALQLLPRPGFVDTFQGHPDGGGLYAYQTAQTWETLKALVRDFWFGDRHAGTPAQDVLDAAAWLWTQDARQAGGVPSLPASYEAKSVYVFGIAKNTPCGLREEPDGKGGVRLKMVGTTRGDGTVSWDSGRIGGIGAFYYMPAQHGDLASATDHFAALVDLLAAGGTTRLATSPPATRDVELAQPVIYDAGPPTVDDIDAIQRGLMGASLRTRAPPRRKRRLEVGVRAMDLRFLAQPILVGHYEQDAIAGAEALIDTELLEGDLTERRNMGLYAGPRGTATVVLRVPNDAERARGSLRGAVVTGLGAYDGALSPSALIEAVRTGVLRYLLQVADLLGKADQGVSLATLLLGYNSSANLSVGASVEALVRGVLEANAKFAETTRRQIGVVRLDIVELYVDTAITAVYELRQLQGRLADMAGQQGTALVVKRELEVSDSMRQRLFDKRSSSYWPRLIVTDADRDDDRCPPDCRTDPRADAVADALDAMAANAAAVAANVAASATANAASATANAAQSAAPGASSATAAPIHRRPPRTALAERLRYLYVGQRARAESLLQQRQPGLIETLVRQQIASTVWQPDFGRMLFQLMVPHDLKDAARELDRVVLVVDSTTANLPWELMLADDPSRSDGATLPLALRTAVVRQLSSTAFRRQVRQAMERTALVVGNPSVAGFGTAFAARGRLAPQPPQLPGAEAEAEAVELTLKGFGYDVTRAIGDHQMASDVLAKLYRRAYRLLHVSAHGVFDLPHVDGGRRSGVVLSDGLLITAAEIAAMETVPELVFLNCCHLGQVDVGRDGNRLAASVSRELIEIGVRCVVVAGWAVDDALASLFGQTFYEHLLLRNRSFGDAVHEARKAAWKANAANITWGAFQAYGDPGWLAEPRADRGGGGDADPQYASPDELLDHLASARADISRRRDRQSDRELRAQVKAIEDTVKRRCPPGWLVLPQLQSALGAAWFDLDELDRARVAFLKAIQAEDRVGKVPIRTIEQLVNVESRLGERRAEESIARDGRAAAGERTVEGAAVEGAAAEPTAGAPPTETAEQLIDLALRRLDRLDELVSAGVTPVGDRDAEVSIAAPTYSVNVERGALRGGAYKRKASLFARRLLAADPGDGAAVESHAAEMREALRRGVDAYRSAEGNPAGGRFQPYLALNRLALDALTEWQDDAARQNAITLARQCSQLATQRHAASLDLWDAVMQPEAKLVEALISGDLGAEGDVGRSTFDAIVSGYANALLNVTLKPAQLDTIITQMTLLSRFCDALAVADRAPERQRAADRLLDLAQRVQPGRKPRDDRPQQRVEAAATEAAKDSPQRRRGRRGPPRKGG